jgi:eukaryotic-like serine/threonine-protein kinase
MDAVPSPARVPTVFSTTAVPNIDPASRPSPGHPGGRSWALSDVAEPDGPPTLRVAVRSPLPAPALPPITPGPLAVTPPPTADIRLPAPVSGWSADGEDDVPVARRGPRIGDTVGGFKLVGELGRGAFARVYLAHQEALAGRPVALKLTYRPTREAERLARLQHTNIVPVYSVHEEGPAQVICMPFLGRTTIADLIRAYRVDHPSRHSGRKSTSARAGRTTDLDSSKSRSSKSAPDSSGRSGSHRAPVWTWAADGPPPIVGDPRAVLEVLSQLAAGLSHAHERGILHLDLKPANVLLADTGEPMLLDFNLSFDAAHPNRELVGGTMPYMAIEQLLDMRARGKGVIDARTDLFALGVMAFEMLTGTVPFQTGPLAMRDIDAMVAARRAGPPALSTLNPNVTPAVEAIIRKLLAAEPADRYQSADELRTDIERHLSDRPLLFAREASLRERFGKWRRRNPGVPLRLLAACLLGLTLGLGGAAHRRAEANARTEAVEHARETRGALDTIRLDLILPDDPKARAHGVSRATELLATYGLPGDSDWRKQERVRLLPTGERTALAGDLGELMFLLAHTKWQSAESLPESERREAIAEAWKLNAAARACFPDSVPPALERQAARLAPIVGEQFAAAAPSDQSADLRHLFLDATDALWHGRYAAAEPQLDRVITAQPSHGAANFLLAYSRRHTGKFREALERYEIARVLLPTDPRPAYHRGLIFGLTKQPHLAEQEFTKVIDLDPNYAEAYRYRGLARFRIGQMCAGNEEGKKTAAVKYAEAESDLTAALERGAPAMYVHCVRELVRDARGEKAAAAADREAAKALVPKTEADFFVRGWSRMEIDPKGAIDDFQKALTINPRSLVALQNQAQVLADKLKNNEAALAVVTKAVELYPEFAPAVAGRAVILARLGQRNEALKLIEKARRVSSDPEILYTAACVYSLTSKNEADRQADQAEALELLRRAYKDGYRDLRGLAKDSDLDALRGLRKFKEIEQAAYALYR